MADLKRRYIVASDPGVELICSRCDRDSEILAQIPIYGETQASRQDGQEQAWFGLCEECVSQLLSGFQRAKGQV